MSDEEAKKEETKKDTPKKDEQTDGVSAVPSADEAIGMVKKLITDVSKSVGEICKDYKKKRE